MKEIKVYDKKGFLVITKHKNKWITTAGVADSIETINRLLLRTGKKVISSFVSDTHGGFVVSTDWCKMGLPFKYLQGRIYD